MLHEFTAFVIKHWALVGAFFIVLILIIIEEAKSVSARGDRVSAFEATRLINKEEAIVIDLRDASSFRDGHIVNAKNIAIADIDLHLEKLNTHRDKPIILVDAIGMKTTPIVLRLKQAGFQKVMTLKGGIEAWKSANMPLVKK